MSAAYSKAEGILARKGARALASACLTYQARRLAGGLSIEDLPDLPCGMDFRDHWEETWEADGLTEDNFAEAIAQAAECVREILAEDGLAELAQQAEDVADGKFGSRYA
jgi:hypothetical protein